MNSRELCQRLKDKTLKEPGTEKNRDLKLRILDFFIVNKLSQKELVRILTNHIASTDPRKEESRKICADILKESESRYGSGRA